MGAYGGYGGGMSGGMVGNGFNTGYLPPQQAGGYGGGMASNGVMPNRGGFMGYGVGGFSPDATGWSTTPGLTNGGMRTNGVMDPMYRMPAGVDSNYQQQLQNALYRQRGAGMVANGVNPDQYAKLQAIVAANHPGWNQNRIDQRAAFRLGKRGM